MRGKLNSFQKTMLQWNHLHPYNAVHVVRVTGELKVLRLTGIINDCLKQSGSTHLSLDLRRQTFDYGGGDGQLRVRIVTAENNPRATLTAEVERQLNSAFELTGDFNPFRFFVVPETATFQLGLVYFHAVADAESIVVLLKQIITAYTEDGVREPTEPMELYPRSHDNLLRHQPRALARRLLTLPTQARDLRRSMRTPVSDPEDMKVGLRLFALSREELRALVGTAKAWQITVNDLLLAMLLKALTPLAGDRSRAGRRNSLSLGCIVNIRKDLGVDRHRTFGLFLGSFMVTHTAPDGISLPQLAADLRDQTQAIKRHRLYLATPWELAIARRLLAFFSPALRKKFYQKNYPLWGGITNMNLNVIWSEDGTAPTPDYFRAVSTGPVTLLVLSISTAGDHANVALSYRTAVFPTSAIEQIKSSLLATLAQLPCGT